MVEITVNKHMVQQPTRLLVVNKQQSNTWYCYYYYVLLFISLIDIRVDCCISFNLHSQYSSCLISLMILLLLSHICEVRLLHSGFVNQPITDNRMLQCGVNNMRWQRLIDADKTYDESKLSADENQWWLFAVSAELRHRFSMTGLKTSCSHAIILEPKKKYRRR